MTRWYLTSLALALLLAGCGAKSSERGMQEAYKRAKEGNWEKVLELTAPRVRDVPGDMGAKALKSLALLHLKGKEDTVSMDEAVELMRQALDAYPKRYDYQFAYGWLLLNLERYEEALPHLREAYDLHIQVDKSKVIGQDVQGNIKYALALCYAKTRQYNEAIKYFGQAQKSSPHKNWPAIDANIGACYCCLGEDTKAVQWMDKAYYKALEENKKIGEDGKPMPPYPDMDIIAINQAVAHEYLGDDKNLTKDWYTYAEQLLREKLVVTQDIRERAKINNLLGTIAKRKTQL